MIPWPNPSTVAMFHNINRNSLPFLQAAGIQPNSQEHRDLKNTVQSLHRQLLHPYKYLEEQTPDSVDELVAKAQVRLPWLSKYEGAWPARVYLKRYVDTRRPHLMRTRYANQKKPAEQKPRASRTNPCSPSSRAKPITLQLDKNPDCMPKDNDSIVKEFLASLTPSLVHYLDAFVKLGVKDQKNLDAFLSWPPMARTQFLDEGQDVLPLTSLERHGLLLGCSLLTFKALQGSHISIVKPGCF